MATYAQLRTEILYKLDVPPGMTGDIRSTVDIVMKRVVDEIAHDFRPRQLLTASTAATVTSAHSSIGLFAGTPNFGITEAEFSEVAFITVDKDTSDDVDPQVLEYVSYEAWQLLNNARCGDERPSDTFTVTEADTVVLRTFPDGSDEWSVKCWYYKYPDAISDSGTPPWNQNLHGIVATGTILQFPHLFQGDRAVLFEAQRRHYDSQYKQLMRAKPGSVKFQKRPGMAHSSGRNFWPTSRVAP